MDSSDVAAKSRTTKTTRKPRLARCTIHLSETKYKLLEGSCLPTQDNFAKAERTLVRSITGHDFSRAKKCRKNLGFSPCQVPHSCAIFCAHEWASTNLDRPRHGLAQIASLPLQSLRPRPRLRHKRIILRK